ncbi:MAG TPA: D-aminoacyl-tRNA deacylase [Savagea sp.]
MRVILQKVKKAKVTVDQQTVGEIGRGFLLLVGITHTDTEKEVDEVAKKIAGLRLFEDEQDKMNWSIDQVEGAVLSVSQFTLYGDTSRGRRPSFIDAARPEQAKPLWDRFNEQLRTYDLQVETGVFGAMMDVELINEGPVTLVVESK